jgi:hypothetical protein
MHTIVIPDSVIAQVKAPAKDMLERVASAHWFGPVAEEEGKFEWR